MTPASFGPDGRSRGQVEMAEFARPLEIGDDYLLALRRDDLGIEYVELYELREANRED